MIDQKVLTTKLLLIAKHFQKDLLPEVMSVWAEYLNAELTTDEFEQAVKEVILHSRFFPTAGEFVEKIKGNKEAQAIREWQSVVTAAAGREEAIAYLSTRGKVALQAVGGLRVIALSEERPREKLEKNFIAVYCQCSDNDARSLPPATSEKAEAKEEFVISPPPESLKRRMEELKNKMSIPKKS
jgi:hypothetical protein